MPRRRPPPDLYLVMVRSLRGQPLPEHTGQGRVIKAPPTSNHDPLAERWDAERQPAQAEPKDTKP